MSVVNLYDYQVPHVNKLVEILSLNPYGFDLSALGTGKTICALKIKEILKFKHLVVIAPLSVLSKWGEVKETYNIQNITSISYCQLRSIRMKQPKHKLLIRKDYIHKVTNVNESGEVTEHDMEKVEFTCSEMFEKMVSEGTLLVIDEIQNIKNLSTQMLSCQTMIRKIVDDFEEKGCSSRVLLLSGSPVDKKVQVIQLYKTLGIMKHDKLSVYNPHLNIMEYRGVLQIENYMRTCYGNGQVELVRNEFNTLTKMNAEEYCYQLFQKIFKKFISSEMTPRKLDNISIRKLNAFYNLNDPTHIELLQKGVSLLKSSSNFNQTNDTINFGTNGIGALANIQRALTMIETAKIPLLIRLAKQYLDKKPTNKLVICVNYTESINDLMTELIHYEPVRLEGSTRSKDRTKIISNFQKPTIESRLIIGNVSVCSTGIDLDDQFGGFERLCIVSPNYSTITLYQLSHRFLRANTKSSSSIHFVFCKESHELSVLNAIAKKSSIMKEVTEAQVASGVIFPGDYEKWEES